MQRSTSGLALAALMAVACAAHAADPLDIVKYRKNLMKANGGLMGAANAIIRGKVDYKGQLAAEAFSLQQTTKDLASLFPKGTEHVGDTQALPAVWSKRAELEEHARDAARKAARFAQAAAGTDSKATAAAYEELAQACKSCHKEFRK